MHLSFHPLEVVSVERTAEDAVCLTLAVPPALRERFLHHAGQYVTVRRPIDGIEERRTYSIVTPPGGSVMRLGVREQTGGRMSGELARRLRAGDRLDVGTPVGRFRTAVDPARTLSYVAFASGSGITPVLSLAADILAREPQSGVTLIYGNRNTARTMFLEETLALKNRYIGRFSVYFVMSREPQHAALMNGRIDAAKVEAMAREISGIASADEYFVCGPGGMVDEVRDAVRRLNAEAPIRLERFAAAAPARWRPPRPPGMPIRAAPVPGTGGRRARRARHRIGGHGRAAPKLFHGADRRVRPGGSRAGGTRAAVLLPLGHLRHLPNEDRRRRGGHDAQHRTRAVGDRRRLRAMLPGAAHDAFLGAEL